MGLSYLIKIFVNNTNFFCIFFMWMIAWTEHINIPFTLGKFNLERTILFQTTLKMILKILFGILCFESNQNNLLFLLECFTPLSSFWWLGNWSIFSHFFRSFFHSSLSSFYNLIVTNKWRTSGVSDLFRLLSFFVTIFLTA